MEEYGEATSLLIALAGSERVSGYSATRAGKTYHVAAYWRSPGVMTASEIVAEISHLESQMAGTHREKPLNIRTRLGLLKREKASRQREGKWALSSDKKTKQATPKMDELSKKISGETPVRDVNEPATIMPSLTRKLLSWENGKGASDTSIDHLAQIGADIVAANKAIKQAPYDAAGAIGADIVKANEAIAKQFAKENPENSKDGCEICGASDHNTGEHTSADDAIRKDPLDMARKIARKQAASDGPRPPGAPAGYDGLTTEQKKSYAAYRSNGFSPQQAFLAAKHEGRSVGFGKKY